MDRKTGSTLKFCHISHHEQRLILEENNKRHHHTCKWTHTHKRLRHSLLKGSCMCAWCWKFQHS